MRASRAVLFDDHGERYPWAMRALVVAAWVSGCSSGVVSGGGRDAETDANDVLRIDARIDAASDTIADAARSDIVEAAQGSDAIDTGPTCTPTRTMCNTALECGAISNGCPGGTVACPPCSGGETWCQTLSAPLWRSRVTLCVSSVSAANPSWFDPTVSCATGVRFVITTSMMAFVSAVAACANGSGAVAVVDPNAPTHEIRVRGATDDVADNYSVILYGSGCSSNRYTSSCTPSFF
jgi:hypothetical protein